MSSNIHNNQTLLGMPLVNDNSIDFGLVLEELGLSLMIADSTTIQLGGTCKLNMQFCF